MSNTSVISSTDEKHGVIVPVAIVLGVAIVHWFVMMICLNNYQFSAAWFPFAFTESPDHQMWQTFLMILEFPIASVTRVLGLAESNLHGFFQMLNSLVWGLLVYLGLTRLIRRRR